MKRLLYALALCALTLVGSACKNPIVVTIFAQTLPVTKTLIWDANPASDQVTNYTVRLDSTLVGNPTTPTQAVVFTTAGAHALTVTATNTWGTSPATTLNVNVVIPGAPGNPRIQ